MSLRATSHGDLQALSLGKAPALDSGLSKSFSNMNSGGSGLRFSSSSGRDGVMEEITDLKPGLVPRRPIRAVRPVSAGGTILQINHLQGELVRKRKECEDLKKENKYLSNEIHMERIMMRTENELTMRNLRNLNHDLQAQVKELKQKLHFSQQRASMCSRAAEDAELKRGEAERVRALAEVRAMDSHKEMDIALDNSTKLTEELQQLKKEHNEVQLSLAKAEKSYFETKLKLDRVSSEKQALLGENRSLEEERDTLRHRLKEMTDDNAKIRDKEVGSRRRALAAEEESQRLSRAQQEAEQGRRLAERERDERTSESLSWREKHQALDSILRAQEDLKAQCRNKACQANIKSYFLCMTESDQRVKILKNSDGSPKNFTEGDPVYISTPEPASDDTETGSSSRTMFRVSAPRSGKDSGPSYFSDLSPMGADSPEPGIARRSRKTVEYFWIPTDEE
ncbi:paramyosin [Engraulis encrasicolus]|uniref:paramyosin n=1 Tax=Engraulis encrasicolus TaxID=184585 RepID=UPI002FCF28A9